MKKKSSYRENNSEVIIYSCYTVDGFLLIQGVKSILFYAHKPMQRRNLSSLFVLFTSSYKATNRIYKEHSSRANQCQSHILLCIPHVTLLTIIIVSLLCCHDYRQ